MADIQLPEGYSHFEFLKLFNEDFFSYKVFKSSFDRHLEIEEGNSENTYVREIGFRLYQIEWDIWNNNRKVEYINAITLRLNIVIESCQQVISKIKAEVEELLNINNEGLGNFNEFYKNIRKDPPKLIKSIRDNNLQNSSTYFFAATFSRQIFKQYLDKFQALARKGGDNKIQHKLSWQKSDTDFLELVTALYESKSINNESKDLTRKDAIGILSQIFDLNIKDAESKLVRATERKKDTSPFLTKLKQVFDDYSQNKLQE